MKEFDQERENENEGENSFSTNHLNNQKKRLLNSFQRHSTSSMFDETTISIRSIENISFEHQIDPLN